MRGLYLLRSRRLKKNTTGQDNRTHDTKLVEHNTSEEKKRRRYSWKNPRNSCAKLNVGLSNLTTRQQAPRVSCLNSTSYKTNGYLVISIERALLVPFIDKDPDASRRPTERDRLRREGIGVEVAPPNICKNNAVKRRSQEQISRPGRNKRQGQVERDNEV